MIIWTVTDPEIRVQGQTSYLGGDISVGTGRGARAWDRGNKAIYKGCTVLPVHWSLSPLDETGNSCGMYVSESSHWWFISWESPRDHYFSFLSSLPGTWRERLWLLDTILRELEASAVCFTYLDIYIYTSGISFLIYIYTSGILTSEVSNASSLHCPDSSISDY